MIDSLLLMGQFGLQCVCNDPPSLPEPMQGIIGGYGNSNTGVYDGGNHFAYNLHQPNSPVFPLSLLPEVVLIISTVYCIYYPLKWCNRQRVCFCLAFGGVLSCLPNGYILFWVIPTGSELLSGK